MTLAISQNPASRKRKDAERSRRWREANPEAVLRQRRLRGQNASASAKRNAVERVRQWRRENRARYNAYQRTRYQNDPIQRAKRTALSKRWTDTHREQSRASVRRQRRNKRAFLAEVVGAACIDCGDDRPGAVEYHHPDGKKKGQVPLTHLSWEALKEEAMRLVALCGACHGVRHYEEEDHG